MYFALLMRMYLYKCVVLLSQLLLQKLSSGAGLLVLHEVRLHLKQRVEIHIIIINQENKSQKEKPVLVLSSGRTVSAINPPQAKLQKSWQGSTFLSIHLPRRSPAVTKQLSERQTELSRAGVRSEGLSSGRKGPANTARGIRRDPSRNITRLCLPSMVVLEIIN